MLIFNFIFQGWPEMAAVIFTSFAIVGYKPNLRDNICYSLLLVAIIYLFRMLPIPFGLHTLVALIAVVLIIYNVTKASLGISFFAAFSTLLIIVSTETLFHFLFGEIIGNVSMDQRWLWIMIGWPQIASLVGIGIIIRKIRPIVIKKQRWLNEL